MKCMVPEDSGRPRWLHEEMNNETARYSFLEEKSNGLNDFRPRLLHHLVNKSNLFSRSSGRPVAQRGEFLCFSFLACANAYIVVAHIKAWLYELDEIVRALFYLVVATWGGGARGTEMELLQYANREGKPRTAFMINGLYTIITSYSKTQQIKGYGKTVARCPAYQATRLLILVLCCGHYAAGYIACYIGMDIEQASRYFYEIFVCSGRPMTSTHFSNLLGEYNTLTTGIELKLADFRQFMACLLISSTSSGFLKLEDEDENVRAAHESFNHSVHTGRSRYALDDVGDATTLASDVISRMQQVSLRWQAFLRLVHPILHEKISVSDMGSPTNSDATNTLIESLFANFISRVSDRFDVFEHRMQLALRTELESLGTQLLQRMYQNEPPPSYSQPIRAMVHKQAKEALRFTLQGRFTDWSSPEQAELVNSVGSRLHVFGILETGAGKSLAFFGASFLMPNHIFVVVSPLVALTEDLSSKLLQLGIRGGVWGRDNIDPSAGQLVIVSAHHAGTDRFYDWCDSPAIRSRLYRIFIDEAHKILTDDYRPCFKLFWRLIELGVPVTCLSGSMMPRMMPFILESLKIRDLSLVDEIRRYTGRPNLKYVVDKVEKDDILDEIRVRWLRASEQFEKQDRGIIFVRTYSRAREVVELLECGMYTGQLNDRERREAVRVWKQGSSPVSCWMAATEAFGQGVDYAHVRCTINENPETLLGFVQETGRAGRDRKPAVCYTVWSDLPRKVKKGDVDHQGRMEMAALLSTELCIRLSFAPLDHVAHSCLALNAELCSTCERFEQIPYHLAILGEAKVPKNLVRSNPRDPTSPLIPSSVETNAAVVHAERQAGYAQLVDLDRLLRRAADHGCLDCFVIDKDHVPTNPHIRDWTFNMYRGQLKLEFEPNINWPFCWICWVPFRQPCGHTPTKPGTQHDTSLCCYQTFSPLTGEYEPIIPTLISLIFRNLRVMPDSAEQFKRLAVELGIDVDLVKGLNMLGPWLKSQATDPSDIPNPARFLLACPVCPQGFSTEIAFTRHLKDDHRENSLDLVRADFGVCLASTSVLADLGREHWVLFASTGCGPIVAPQLDQSVRPRKTRTEKRRSDSPASFSQPPRKKVKTIMPVPDTDKIDLTRVAPSFSPLQILNYVGTQLQDFVNTCPFEAVVFGRTTTNHSFMFHCPDAHGTDYVDEFKFWKESLAFLPYSACHFCLCPQLTAFGGHPINKPCRRKDEANNHTIDREGWKAWICTLPYLIFKVHALRDLVFGQLGIPSNSFPTLDKYEAWVADRVLSNGAAEKSTVEKLTHLILVAFVYFRLMEDGRVVVPTDGFALDAGPSAVPDEPVGSGST
ncbi:hypothetical protein D9757_009899 [Collybiopsis confluens]|uniref:DNA 3'-5' helicase n=1 Tax=Collybiopsis confluens TaxID=2823264 RepID=A0A8H5GU45_9AGAR|nr:hypothetical protein D9757_009899 [Collybiopsis confluens]